MKLFFFQLQPQQQQSCQTGSKWDSIELIYKIKQHKDHQMEISDRSFHQVVQYNMDIAPNKTSLSTMEKKTENIREYA